MRRRISIGLAALLAALPAVILFAPAPAIGANSLQSVLSPAGLSAYDTATSGSYFAVSETDFAAATNNLSSVTKLGVLDSQKTTSCGVWSGNYAIVLDNTIMIPANAYILGYAIRMYPSITGTQYGRLISSGSYKGTYDFLVSANYPKSVGDLNYYLFKDPVTTSSLRYIGLWASTNLCGVSYASTTGGYLAGTTGPFSGTFSVQSNSFPFLQILYTTIDQWAVPATISVSVAGNASAVSKGSVVQLTSTQNKDGLVTFRANGKNIGNCVSLASSAMSATCNWKPAIQGSVAITATLRSPTVAYAAVTSQALRVSINKRSTKR
jgi:hypothetical protein